MPHTTPQQRSATLLARLFPSPATTCSAEEFIAASLHDPGCGYYASNPRIGGSNADFTTAPEIAPLLGRTLARWAKSQAPPQGTWHLIEIGAGNGTLAFSLLKELGWAARRRLHYHIVESSTPLRTLQQTRLRGQRVTWHDHPRDALNTTGGHALLFSNELVDAFPCAVLEFDGTAWSELHLRLGPTGALETFLLPLTDRIRESQSVALSAPNTHGQRIEVHLAYREWLHSWSDAFLSGQLLTIDYGDRFPALYQRRKNGTLRAYNHHQALTGKDCFHRPGQQDITADVNFSDLESWGTALGLHTRDYLTQREFVLRWNPRAAQNPEPATRFLLEPDGAGTAFKVLIQERR